jgi:hypothetical protein
MAPAEIFRLPMFDQLARDWMAMPKVLDEGIAAGMVARERPLGWVPLKGLSPISDAFPPKAYAKLGFARVYNKAIRKFRRREAFSAFIAGISKADLEARLEAFAQLSAGLERFQGTARPPDPDSD